MSFANCEVRVVVCGTPDIQKNIRLKLMAVAVIKCCKWVFVRRQ
jgi:hypothetical protein